MPNDIATVATWQINCSSRAGGNKRIRRMKDWNYADGASKETVGEVGSTEHVGFMRKPGGKTITFNIRERKGAKPEIDWEYLADSDEVFSLTKQIRGGRRTQYPECQVSKVDDQGEEEGEIMYSVEIVVLTRKAM